MSFPNRRQTLQSLAAAGLATIICDAAASPTALNETITDAHSHIWTRDIKKYPLAKNITLDDLKPGSFSTQELLAAATPLGIGRVVLIQHNIFYAFDNSYMIDAAKAHPDVFRIVGTVDPGQDHPDQAMRRLLQHKVTGFRITPRFGADRWLDSRGMQQMWKCAAETRQPMCCLINPEDLADIDTMCGNFPETPVVIDHFARIGIDGQFRDRDVKQLCGLAKHRHTTVKVSAFYALGNKQPPYDYLTPMIRRLHEAFGAKRLMWASDCPYQIDGQNTYAASLKFAEQIEGFSAAEKRELLNGTAGRVFYFM